MKFLTSVGKASFEQKENFRPLFKERKSTLMIVKEGDAEDAGPMMENKINDLRTSEKRKSDQNSQLILAAQNGKKRPSMLNENIGMNHMEGAFEGIEDKVWLLTYKYFK